MSQQLDLEGGIARFQTTNLPQIADFMSWDEDNDLIIFRKFKTLNLTALLWQQNQLSAIERKVMRYQGKDAEKLNELLPRACRQLRDYNNALLQQEQILKLAKPAKHLSDFLVKESNYGRSELKCFITTWTTPDLISLVSKPKGLIHRWIDGSPTMRFLFLKRRRENQPPGLQIYAERHVRRAEKLVVNLIFGALVLIPIIVLPRVTSIRTKLMVIVGAIAAAAVLVAGVLEDYHRTSLSLMVGYTAILVVFLGSTI